VNDLISFEFDNHTVVDIPWSDTENSDPEDDLFNAAERVAQSGYTAEVAIGDSESMRNLIRNKRIKEMLDKKDYNMGVIAPERLRNGAMYLGYLREPGLHLYSYNARFADNDNENPDFPGIKPEDKGFVPATYSLVPRGKVAVAPMTSLGRMLYGVIKDLQIGSHAKPRVPKQWDQEEPSEKYLKISSRPLPCPDDLDKWVTLDVL